MFLTVGRARAAIRCGWVLMLRDGQAWEDRARLADETGRRVGERTIVRRPAARARERTRGQHRSRSWRVDSSRQRP